MELPLPVWVRVVDLPLTLAVLLGIALFLLWGATVISALLGGGGRRGNLGAYRRPVPRSAVAGGRAWQGS